MQCPDCKNELILKEREGHIGYVCQGCSGSLLTKKFISTLPLSNKFDVPLFYNSLELNAGGVSQRNCPICKCHMKLAEYKNIELDWCSSCSGVWFDFQELGKAITKARGFRESKNAKVSDSYIAFQLVADFLNLLT